MTTVAFFAHDEKDAAIRRRVESLQDTGCDVVGFAMRRGERVELGWNKVDLGRTYDAHYIQRLSAIVRGARRTAAARRILSNADVIYARNLDTALCAQIAMKVTGISRPFVFECLDIHRLLHRRNFVGFLMRRLERTVLANSTLLVVSSPAFLRNHFDRYHAGRFTPRLIENRILDHAALGDRPLASDRKIPPLRIGWFGVLRCERSFHLIERLAARFKDQVEIVMAGYPDRNLRNFHERIRKHLNIRFKGRYKSPEDLSELYASVDVVWAGDFHDAGFNSQWLLPNRIYEGGYFGTPAIAPAASETGEWIKMRQSGFTLAEPLETTLHELVHQLLCEPSRIAIARDKLLSMPGGAFVQPANEMNDVIQTAAESFNAPDAPRSTAPAAVIAGSKG